MGKKTILDYRLACISEEAGEIVQAVGKAERFGFFDVNPDTQRTAWLQIRHEIHDLISVYEDFCQEFDRVSSIDRELVENKKVKSANMLAYAQRIGHVETS